MTSFQWRFSTTKHEFETLVTQLKADSPALGVALIGIVENPLPHSKFAQSYASGRVFQNHFYIQ